MAIKPVSLTYGGDASAALMWAGFAKKKARQLADWCAATGQPAGVKREFPTPDITIVVQYNNGFLRAHVEAVGRIPWGFAFNRLDTTTTGWWNSERTRDKVIIPTFRDSGLVALGPKKYRSGLKGGALLHFGYWACQELPNGQAITIGEYALYLGRSEQPFPTPSRSYNSRHFGRIDIRYPSGTTTTSHFYTNGKQYATDRICYGAWRYNGEYIIIQISSSTDYTSSPPQGGPILADHFGDPATLELRRATVGPNSITTVGGSELLDTLDVTYHTMTNEYPGQFIVSQDGSFAVARYYSNSIGTVGPTAYAQVTTVDDVVIGTMTLVSTSCAFVLSPVVAVCTVDSVAVPVVFAYASDPAAGATNFLLMADTAFNGNYTVEVIRVALNPPGPRVEYIFNINVERGLIGYANASAEVYVLVLDFSLGTYSSFLLEGLVAPVVSNVQTVTPTELMQVQTREDDIFVSVGTTLRIIYRPTYDIDGVITAYTAYTVQDISGMSPALGVDPSTETPYPASDVNGNFGFYGVV